MSSACAGVHDQQCRPSVDQHHGAHPGIAADADGRPHQQPGCRCPGGQRVLPGLDEVLTVISLVSRLRPSTTAASDLVARNRPSAADVLTPA